MKFSFKSQQYPYRKNLPHNCDCNIACLFFVFAVKSFFLFVYSLYHITSFYVTVSNLLLWLYLQIQENASQLRLVLRFRLLHYVCPIMQSASSICWFDLSVGYRKLNVSFPAMRTISIWHSLNSMFSSRYCMVILLIFLSFITFYFEVFRRTW